MADPVFDALIRERFRSLHADAARGEALWAAAKDGDGLKWATHHRTIIERFGRFPHRNEILGRAMTAEEQAFLDAEEFKD